MIKSNKQVVKLFMVQCDYYKLTKLGINLKKNIWLPRKCKYKIQISE